MIVFVGRKYTPSYHIKVPSYYNVPIKLYSICTELNNCKIISLNTDVKEKVNKMAEKMAAASGG